MDAVISFICNPSLIQVNPFLLFSICLPSSDKCYMEKGGRGNFYRYARALREHQMKLRDIQKVDFYTCRMEMKKISYWSKLRSHNHREKDIHIWEMSFTAILMEILHFYENPLPQHSLCCWIVWKIEFNMANIYMQAHKRCLWYER